MPTRIFKLNIKYLFLFFTFYLFTISSQASTLQQSKNTPAHIELTKENIANLKNKDTVLGSLIKASGKNLGELLEKDEEHLLSFSLTYTAPVKLKGELHAKDRTITQYGLYRTLDPKIQSYLQKNRLGDKIKIRFIIEDPVSIQFVIGDDILDAPSLLTDTIDAGWKEKIK